MEAQISYDFSQAFQPVKNTERRAETRRRLWNAYTGATIRGGSTWWAVLPDISLEPGPARRRVHGGFGNWGFANIAPERTDSEEIFDAIQAFYLSDNRGTRDRQIATRITALHRAALSEGEHIRSKSLGQFKDFFLSHRELSLPKITLTPDGTIRARWIHGPGNFLALEFTGEPLAKLVAEIPRPNGLTARHFSSEPLSNIIAFAQACGASFA